MSEPGASRHLTINDLAPDDRPREKLMLKGPRTLSDAELIGILFATGTTTKERRYTAVELGQHLLDKFASLDALNSAHIKQLCQINGIGNAKAITLKAAMELGRRVRAEREGTKYNFIKSPQDIYDYVYPTLAGESSELLVGVFLRRNNSVISQAVLGEGGRSGAIVDIAKIFKNALLANASNLILVHNHPSGNAKPSQEDIDITRQIKKAGDIMQIPLLDHLIFADSGQYTSLANEGLI